MAIGERLTRASDLDVLGLNVGASSCRAAGKGSDVRSIAAVCSTLEVLEQNVRDGQRARVVVAQCQVLLAVALIHLNGVLHLQ